MLWRIFSGRNALNESIILSSIIWSPTNQKAFISGVRNGFCFDAVAPVKGDISNGSNDLVEQMALGKVAFLSPRCVEIPLDAREGVQRMLLTYGHKKDIQKWGRYVTTRMAINRSEGPSVLPSALLPKDFLDDKDIIGKIQSSLGDFHKLESVKKEIPSMAELQLRGIADAGDSSARYKLLAVALTTEGALGYVGHLFGPQFASHYRILLELSRRVANFTPRRCLHFGAGAGPSLIAANEVWGSTNKDVSYAIERNVNLANMGKYLVKGSDILGVTWRQEAFPEIRNLDLVICNFSIGDLRTQSARDHVVKDLWGRLNYGGVLVVVEPGSPYGFRMIHCIRDMFINQLAKNRFHIVAPCPHEGLCPLSLTGKDYCHFKQDVRNHPEHIYKKNAGNREPQEKATFSYIALRKCEGPRVLYASEDEAPDAISKSYFWPRLISKKNVRSEEARLNVCCPPCSYKEFLVKRRDPAFMQYKAARSLLSGDLWRAPVRVSQQMARREIPEKVVNLLRGAESDGHIKIVKRINSWKSTHRRRQLEDKTTAIE